MHPHSCNHPPPLSGVGRAQEVGGCGVVVCWGLSSLPESLPPGADNPPPSADPTQPNTAAVPSLHNARQPPLHHLALSHLTLTLVHHLVGRQAGQREGGQAGKQGEWLREVSLPPPRPHPGLLTQSSARTLTPSSWALTAPLTGIHLWENKYSQT